MKIIEKAELVLKNYVCDHCLGRQFGQLLSGYSNAHRGRLVRSIVAMSIDKETLNIEERALDMLNFTGFSFHFLPLDIQKMKEKINGRKCYVCGNIFQNLHKYIEIIEKSLRGLQFNTFLIGTKLSHDLSVKEEHLWEQTGIDYCEPIKGEINREIGKLLEEKLKKKFSVKNPDIVIMLNLESKNIELQINPTFIYGEYQKLVRGIPQTKWPEKKYKTSVEEIIAKPYISYLKGKNHKLHGYGREDIDALCLGWRPFVLEILEPKKRLDKKTMIKLARQIGKQVNIRNIKPSDILEVRKIKEARGEKTYRALVICETPIKKEDIKKLNSLVGNIKQKTPQRVLHRRSDLLRNRKLISMKTKFINKKQFEIIVRTEAGLYVKELIHGDSGRTQPSISQILENKCKCKELDVLAIHVKK
ncbi:MAG: tRNA pseudouridine(54/55) synthase Pus10 [Candidatus Aenigmarchaeota archaeon]|nr:tRNA pseudouridine(54/55) synthase Pus10 [Candidatus Aenigmarchaeota archaeon]